MTLQYISGTAHESTQQSQEPTLDMVEQFGHGTKQQMSTGADLVERTMPVQITNPAMRNANATGRPVREEMRRITARATDVAVRSGNQQPDQVIDKDINHGFIWGYKGTGEAPAQPGLMERIPAWGWIALAAGGLYLGMMAGGKRR